MQLGQKKKAILARLGIPIWELRKPRATKKQEAEGSSVALPDKDIRSDKEHAWTILQQEVSQCRQCVLNKTRTQTVFGVGDKQAHWMFIGEAPGADEDRQGEPFVGRAGQLLTAMIAALQLSRSQVYIANILKCRPPRNRDPLPAEVDCCEPFLQRQLELIRPRIIVALGRIAAQNILKTDERIGVLRGRRFYYGPLDIPLVVTYHPAYLLRSPLEKRKVWQDLCLAKSILQNTQSV